jgi:hypothetical protein
LLFLKLCGFFLASQKEKQSVDWNTDLTNEADSNGLIICRFNRKSVKICLIRQIRVPIHANAYLFWTSPKSGII